MLSSLTKISTFLDTLHYSADTCDWPAAKINEVSIACKGGMRDFETPASILVLKQLMHTISTDNKNQVGLVSQKGMLHGENKIRHAHVPSKKTTLVPERA